MELGWQVWLATGTERFSPIYSVTRRRMRRAVPDAVQPLQSRHDATAVLSCIYRLIELAIGMHRIILLASNGRGGGVSGGDPQFPNHLLLSG